MVPLVPRDGGDDLPRSRGAQAPRRALRRGEGRRRLAAGLRGALRRLGMAGDGADDGRRPRRSASTRGTSRPRSFVEILRAAVASPAPMSSGAAKATAMQPGPSTEGQLGRGARPGATGSSTSTGTRQQGSWGDEQKVPLFWDNAWALAQAQGGRRRRAEAGPLHAGSAAGDHRSRLGRHLPVLDRRRLAAPALREAHDVPGRRHRQLRRGVRPHGRRRVAPHGAARARLRRPLPDGPRRGLLRDDGRRPRTPTIRASAS